MSKRAARFLFLVAACLFGASGLMAQVSTVGRLTGTVTDPTAAAIAGADVKTTDDATGVVYETKSGPDGSFLFGNLKPGIYTVTVTMPGFRKGVFRSVKIVVGGTYDLDARLEVGEVTSTVMVEAGQEVLETMSATVGTTITGKSITQLPFTSRDALDLGILMPGAQTTGRPRQTSFMGLPKGSINITFDGINAQDNINKSSDGFFTTIRPRVDAVEEFSISTAAQGAEQAGEGAVQIRFETKRGGNAYHGGVWWYHRNDFLNANYYFNNLGGIPRQRFRLNEFGYKVGGPIIKDKLFFFTDFDFYRNPQSVARTRTILTTAASQGLFSYVTASAFTTTSAAPLQAWMDCGVAGGPGFVGTVPRGTTCTATLLGTANSLAASGGVTNAVDTTIAGILGAINTSVSAPGVGPGPSTGQPYTRAITFNNPAIGNRYFPDFRFDWNITKSHQFTAIYHFSDFISPVDTLNSRDRTFPVAPFSTAQAGQNSNRNQFAGAWRWNIGSNKSNEVRVGAVSAPVWFFKGIPSSVYPAVTTNLGSTRVNPSFPDFLNSPFLPFGSFPRNTALGQLIETFSWTRGKHSLSFGGSTTLIYGGIQTDDAAVGSLGLGVDANDPASPLFGTSSFPGAAKTDIDNATALYGLLAGRITSYSGVVYVDDKTRQFTTGVPLNEKYRQNEFGFYASDTWRFRPSLTLSYGLRWEYQGAPYETNNIYFRARGGAGAGFGISGPGNLFKPGTLTGTTPVFELNNGQRWWDRDFHDFAPSVGLAWQPSFENNIWKAIFGGAGKTVFRGGYSITYTREGTDNWLTRVEDNLGYQGSQFLTAVAPGRPTPTGTFTAGKLQLQSGNLSNVAQDPPSFVTSFPINPTQGQSVNVFQQDLRVPRVQSWSIGIQREITRNMVLEVRYVGNHGTGLWRRDNLNEINIFENGFLREFVVAQRNLAICRAQMTPCTFFSNLGLTDPVLGTQLPVPIMTMAFTGSRTGSQTVPSFRNGARITQLDNGLAGSFANVLATNLTFWQNLIAAGEASNFWRVNPHARGGAFLLHNGTNTTYNALQIEFRRRPSKGLQFNGNYTWSKSLSNFYADSGSSATFFDTFRDTRRQKGPAPHDLRHAFKMQLIYELPFGPGRRWSSSYGFLNRIIEGWEFNSITRWQSGRVARIDGGLGGTVNQNDGGVQLIGLTPNQLQGQLGIIKSPPGAPGTVFWIPPSLLDSRLAKANPSFLSGCKTPGSFCSRLFIRGPQFFRADWSIAKRTRITEQVNVEFRAEFLNAFNNVNFLYGGSAATGVPSASLQSGTFGQSRFGYQDLSTTDDPGGRIIQMVLRINF